MTLGSHTILQVPVKQPWIISVNRSHESIEQKNQENTGMYPQTSNIKRSKFQLFNVSRLVVQLSLSNPLKPGVKSRTKM